MHTQSLFSKDDQAFDYTDFLIAALQATNEKNSTNKKILEAQLLVKVSRVNLTLLEKWERIYLMDGAIKLGQVAIVKALAGKFIVQGYADDIRIPSEDNKEHPFRPSFWLAAVATRHAPVANYETIEAHLCKVFNVPSRIEIDNKTYTRDEYVQMVNEWKIVENERLQSNYGMEIAILNRK